MKRFSRWRRWRWCKISLLPLQSPFLFFREPNKLIFCTNWVHFGFQLWFLAFQALLKDSWSLKAMNPKHSVAIEPRVCEKEGERLVEYIVTFYFWLCRSLCDLSQLLRFFRPAEPIGLVWSVCIQFGAHLASQKPCTRFSWHFCQSKDQTFFKELRGHALWLRHGSVVLVALLALAECFLLLFWVV